MEDQRTDFDEDPAFLEEGEDIPEDSSEPIISADVTGLLYLGHLEDSFEFGGHSFVLATPKGDVEVAIAQLVDEFSGVMAILILKSLTKPDGWACLISED